MTKEELDKKRDELANKIFLKPNNTMEDDFKAGFDSAVNLLLPRLDEAEERLLELDALERMGVKHWEWYDEAMELIND